ncbi:MAG: L-2-hydroxyglutarate oxidase [bacterium]
MNSFGKADVLICGCGIVGLTLGRELLRSGYENIVIMEKEEKIGQHASGRNSGVLHAGIYYAPDKLKARFCLKGNRLMKEYCRQKGLPILETGKVIVTRGEEELDTLQKLYDRSLKNGAKVKLIDEQELSEIEPLARTCKKALYSYYTAVVDPRKILDSLYDDLISSGKVRILKSCRFTGITGGQTVTTSCGTLGYGLFINAAGAHSDKVAHAFGVGLDYKFIPFKGIYRKLIKEKSSLVNGNIYPVPNMANPFLGVHFTKDVYGDVYLGPTAIPALGRENYGLVRGMDLELFEILYREALLFFSNAQFRQVALTEPKKYFFKNFFEEAEKLVKKLEPADIEESDKAGIRPQLLDWRRRELVMDFMVIKKGNTVHILNAVSPAFTCSIPFAEYVVNEYIKQ